jgi:hypothetical protein
MNSSDIPFSCSKVRSSGSVSRSGCLSILRCQGAASHCAGTSAARSISGTIYVDHGSEIRNSGEVKEEENQ